jgi:iron-sulfur cluster insertion protein
VSVTGGGCSGFRYGFSLDNTVRDDDVVFCCSDIEVVIDEVSLGLLNGVEIDYIEELIGSSFSIRNPNADSACSCGASFAL